MCKCGFQSSLSANSVQGTRAYVYRWLNAAKAKSEADDELLQSLPAIQTKKSWTKKVHPGVSTFGDKPELIGSDHLHDLVKHALDVVPKHEVENTPIFLLATAGMRLLPEHQRNAVLDKICSYLQKNTKFQLPDCGLHIQVIPGETEGLYGWIAANYLLGGFDAPGLHDHGKGHHTYGFLDMGGASAQIAFAPNVTEAEKHANDLQLLRLRTLDGDSMEYRVFVTTWLGYGVNEARRRYVESLLETSPGALELPDPCLPSGLTVTKSGHVILPGSSEAAGDESHLLGTGKFTECLKRTFPLLDKNAPCEDPPCLLHGVHVPAIDLDVNHFVGVSEYWHTTHEIFEMDHKDKAYDFQTYQERVVNFCSQDWHKIQKGIEGKQWGKSVDETTAVEVCFKASWLINMLHEGIGIPREGIEPTQPINGDTTNGTKAILDGAKNKGFLDPFQAVDKIDDTEVSWTLGKMVLYASSQVPPTNNAMAVGFGSNIPGTSLPKDFQYAGGKYDSLPDDLEDVDGGDWHDALFNAGSSRRLPGLLLFLVIVVVVVILLCGRDRRLSLFNRFLSFLGRDPYVPGRMAKKRKGFFGGKLFGSGQAYERIDGAGDSEELELGTVPDGYDSDDSLSAENSLNHKGISSGWATPAPAFESPAISHSSPRSKGYFDLARSGTPGLGINGPNVLDRAGLISRTESRERLVNSNTAARSGSKSRNGSPTRRSPLMAPFKANRH